jgi:hypothetical protein
MKSNIKPSSQEQSVSDLPPFDWRGAVVRARPSTMAGSYVARKFHIASAFADLIADLAGLGEVRA